MDKEVIEKKMKHTTKDIDEVHMKHVKTENDLTNLKL